MNKVSSAIMRALRDSSPRRLAAEEIVINAGLPIEAVERFLASSKQVVTSTDEEGKTVYGVREKSRGQIALAETSESKAKQKKPLKCLVLLPSNRGVETAYHLSRTVNEVLLMNGVSAISFEDRVATGALWVDGVLASLREADFIIADVTNRNPNVLFELGIAHGLGKPFVLLVSANSEGDMPSDLLGYQYITYDPYEEITLSKKLNRFVGHVASRLEESK